MWLMLQKKKPSDYVISTGISRTVKNFAEEAFKNILLKLNGEEKELMKLELIKKQKFFNQD